MRRRGSSVRFLRRCALGSVIGVLGLTSTPAPAVAAPELSGSIIGSATAEGVRVQYSIPDFLLLSTLFDGAGPISESVLNYGSSSIGWASLPYPGDTVVFLPSLLNVIAGASVPYNYPLYARSDYPTTPSDQAKDATGQFDLSASSSPTAVTAIAALGGGAGDSQVSGSTMSTSVNVADDGTMTVVADSVTRGLDFAEGLLRIAAVRTHSASTYKPGDVEPVSEAVTTLDAVRVADLAVTIGPDGVSLFGQATPMSFPGVDEALNGLLAAAGVSVRMIPSQKIKGGVSGGVLEVRTSHPVPLPGNEKTGTVVLRVGGTLASVALPRGPVVLDSGASGMADGAAAEVSTGDLSDSTSDVVLPDVDADVAGAPISLEPSSDPAPLAEGRGRSAQASDVPTARLEPLDLAGDVRATTRVLYSILVIAAALLLSSTAMWRAKGAKATWIS